jgi:hypothetical protein
VEGAAKFDAQAYFAVVDNGNSGASKTINWTLGNKQIITLNNNCTLSFTAPSGACSMNLVIKQDAGGSRTITWPAAVKWSNDVTPTLTTTGSAVDIVSLIFDGTDYYAAAALNFI